MWKAVYIMGYGRRHARVLTVGHFNHSSCLTAVGQNRLIRAVFSASRPACQSFFFLKAFSFKSCGLLLQQGYWCQWPFGVRFETTLRDTSQDITLVHSHLKPEKSQLPVDFPSRTTAEVSAADPKCELVVDICGINMPIKAVDLYSLIRRLTAEEVVKSLLSCCFVH